MATREDSLKAAQSALQSGDFARGLTLCSDLLADEDTEALYIAAVASRYLTRHDEAAAYLARLHAVSPEYGRAWQEEGHLASARGDAAHALTAFTRATRFNPA
ncbi:MAG: hypothetical protein WA906_12065, partial [Pacificimonas sp.]